MYTYNKLYFQYKKLYSIYLKKIVLILNKFHQKKYSNAYWEPIIGLYLRRFILNYLFLKDRLSQKKNFNSLNIKKVKFFRNYREFSSFNDFEIINKKYFNKFNSVKEIDNYKIKKLNLFLKAINSIKIFPSNLLIKLKITKVLFFESYFKKNLRRIFSLKSFLYFFSLPNLKLETYKVDKLKILKNRVNLLKNSNDLIKSDILLKNIIFSMPINYIENYETIFNEVEKISLSNALYVDGTEVNFDFIKFLIAKLRINKKKILTGQHSLRSGIQDYDSYFDYIKSISSRFLTWGWNDKSNLIYKFSSFRIFSSTKKYKKIKKNDQTSNICFILCSYSKVGECLYDNFIENKKAENARIKLLDDLNNFKKNKIFLKPRTGSFIIDKKKKFYQKFDIYKEKTRMYDIFGKFDVVVFERLSLGIVESIYLDQPTIFYYPKNLYKTKNRQYNQLISLLKKANIYFTNIDKIKEIIKSPNNVSNWWYKKKNIRNRKRVLKNFADVFGYEDFNKIRKII